MNNPYQVVKDFERAVGEYTGAPYVVAVNSCTMALLLAVAWHLRNPMHRLMPSGNLDTVHWEAVRQPIEIPKRTYVSVPMSIIHAGGRPTFRDEEWSGFYQLEPLNVWDYARYFTSGMWLDRQRINHAGAMLCTSHHWSKTLGLQQGGCILHDNAEADMWLRKARFDGRTEGIPPVQDTFDMVGWHCTMSPEIAALGLVRLHFLPKHNDPMPNDEYPDLSQMEIFQ